MTENSEAGFETPRIETSPERSFAGRSVRFTRETMQKIPQLWQEVGPALGSIPGGIGSAAYGMAFDLATGGNDFEYLAGVEVSGKSVTGNDYRNVMIPARTYAVFAHTGHVSQIGATCEAIFSRWIPTSGFDPRHDDGAPDLIEYYGPGFDPVTGFGDTEIWIPVTQRT